MSRIKKILSFLMATLMTLCIMMIGYAEKVSKDVESSYESSLENDDIADDRILVLLDNDTSMMLRSYSASDFPEINCKNVIDLTLPMIDKMKEEIKQGSFKKNETQGYSRSSNSFNQVLALELETTGKEQIWSAIKKLENKEGILSVAPDYVTYLETTPDDPGYSNQWAASTIKLPSAWNITTGSSSVVVGIMDSGIDGNHPDLSERIKTAWCRSFLSNNNTSNNPPTDPIGHGTSVAGIIGARGNNTLGICGVCWNVRLASLKVAGSDGLGYSSYVASAISYAESKEIKILNLSMGWKASNPRYNYVLQSVIQNYSGLLVCAAGNNGENLDTVEKVYPACYTLSNLITVGASNSSDSISSFSNYGCFSVDIFAPGEGIYTTCKSSENNGYAFVEGTSFAAPHVTGVAALLLAKHPSLSASGIKKAIVNNVNNIFSTKCTSGGRLNAYKALNNYTHVHSFTYTNYGNGAKHKCTCSSCGCIVYKAHQFTQSGNSFVCTKCNYVTNSRGVTKTSHPY